MEDKQIALLFKHIMNKGCKKPAISKSHTIHDMMFWWKRQLIGIPWELLIPAVDYCIQMKKDRLGVEPSYPCSFDRYNDSMQDPSAPIPWPDPIGIIEQIVGDRPNPRKIADRVWMEFLSATSRAPGIPISTKKWIRNDDIAYAAAVAGLHSMVETPGRKTEMMQNNGVVGGKEGWEGWLQAGSSASDMDPVEASKRLGDANVNMREAAWFVWLKKYDGDEIPF